MPVTRSTEGSESTSKKSTRTAKAAAVPEAAASASATAKKAPAKTEPAAGKPKKAAATAEAKPAPGATPEAGTASNPPRVEITPEQKLQMIAEAAYFRAERRGFVGGNPTEDWVAAEAEVEARLSQKPAQKK